MEFNRNFKGNINFGEGFATAQKSYASLSWWERLFAKPIGIVYLDYTTNRSEVDYCD